MHLLGTVRLLKFWKKNYKQCKNAIFDFSNDVKMMFLTDITIQKNPSTFIPPSTII